MIEEYAEVAGKRVRLIIKKFSRGLTPNEITELTELTDMLRRLMPRVTPEDFNKLTKLSRAALLPVTRGARPTYTDEDFERVQRFIDAGYTIKEACYAAEVPTQRWYRRKTKTNG